MAAGLGSSLSLLHSLSVHPSQPPAELSSPPSATPRSKMGSLFSKEKHRRSDTHDNYRPSSSRSRAAEKPQQSYSQYQPLRPVDPRDQRPNARLTGKNRPPKPQYTLNVYCTDCLKRNNACRMATALNVMMPNSTYAYRDPMHDGDVTQWALGIDLCSPLAALTGVMKKVEDVVKRFTGDATYGGTRKDLFPVEKLLEGLGEKNVKFVSSV